MITAGLLRGGSGVTYGRRIPASFVVARRPKLFHTYWFVAPSQGKYGTEYF